MSPDEERRVVERAAEAVVAFAEHRSDRGGPPSYFPAEATADALLTAAVGEPVSFAGPYWTLARRAVASWQRQRGRPRRARAVVGEAGRPPKAREVSELPVYGETGGRELLAAL